MSTQKPTQPTKSSEINLPTEVLTGIYQSISSPDLLKVRQISKKWLDVIDETKNIWRSLIIDPTLSCRSETLEMFDRKSQSGLIEVSISIISNINSIQLSELFAILSKSKKSLRFLSLYVLKRSENHDDDIYFSKLLWEFPKLLEFKLINNKNVNTFSTSSEFKSENNSVHIIRQPNQNFIINSSKIEVLWIFNLDDNIRNHHEFLSNLSSLSIDQRLDVGYLRRMLKKSSRNLKHLRVRIETDEYSYLEMDSDEEEENQDEDEELDSERVLPKIDFPNLKVLELLPPKNECEIIFPYWFKLPENAAIISHQRFIPFGLPSVVEFWTEGFEEVHDKEEEEEDGVEEEADGVEDQDQEEEAEEAEDDVDDDLQYGISLKSLANRCPILSKLRFDLKTEHSNEKERLKSVLIGRKENVINGFEVDEIPMIPLKTLIIPFKYFSESEISDLKELVEEVIDSETSEVRSFIEVEI